ncbi:MAG: S1C family serine protease [Patescibacteria group bacterium]
MKINKSLIIVILIAFFVGGLSGAVTGFYAGTFSSGNTLSLLKPIIPHKELSQPSSQNQSPIISPSEQPSKPSIKNEVQEESAVVAAVKKVSPAVVSIVVSKYVSRYYGPESLFPEDFFEFSWPFSFRFQFPQPKEEQKKEKQEVGGGTGFVISSADGLILTNKHVVADEEAEYTVITNEGQKFEAKVLARDPFNDIAVLKVEKINLAEVELGDSDKLEIGQTVVAIGNALGEYRNTVTRGVISGIGRTVTAGDNTGRSEVLENVIQTDAAINPGNSGGPLINLKGQVIGINVAMNLSGQLIGFAIPINQAKSVIASVKKYGKIVRPFLGVRYIIINEAIAKANNLSVNYGALILRGKNPEDLAITPGGPADKAGLVENDIILEINKQKIDEQHTLAKEIQKYKPGDEVELKVLSKGKEKTVKVTLEEYKQ